MKKSLAIGMAVAVGVTVLVATILFMQFIVFPIQMEGSENSISLEEFAKVDKIINEYYLRDYDVKDLQNAGLKAMVASLNDPYSVYFTPEEFEAFTQNVDGEYYGLGMLISIDESNGLAMIVEFYDGSPAKEAGLEVGDYIVSINGEDVTKKTLQEISAMCIGEVGTPITLGVMRNGDVHEYSLERQVISADMLTYKMIDDEIGYMYISQFGGNCAELYKKAMNEFVQNGAKGVIIDLRNNPGGYMDIVVSMLDMLLPEGTLVYTENKEGYRVTESSDAQCMDIAVTLIVNGNTASAAEIFTGAVQDFDYGEVVGTTTFGKGVVQSVRSVSDSGSGIKITISEYFTPKGRSINGNGIYPDYYIELPEGYAENPTEANDTQLIKALEVLRQSFQ